LILAAKLWIRCQQPDAPTNAYGLLITILGRFGMTPSDRSKVVVTPNIEVDEWDDL
jgi:hypothetical protein